MQVDICPNRAAKNDVCRSTEIPLHLRRGELVFPWGRGVLGRIRLTLSVLLRRTGVHTPQ